MRFLRGLFLLLIVVAAGGGANYVRNAPLDAELADRPYATLNARQIEALLAAYQAEVENLQAFVAVEPQARRSGASADDRQGKWQDFERFQRDASQWKARRSRLLECEVRLGKLDH